MYKFNILDMKSFLQAVNACKGKVYLAEKNGRMQRIDHAPEAQQELTAHFEKAGKYLPVTLRAADPGDSIRLACYYAGDC